MRTTITFIIFLFSSTFLFAQTPVQSYFEWTNLPFTKEELSERRDNLMSILEEQGKSGVIVIPANDGFSFGETFRQADDFYYFTGLELPNAILVMNVANHSVTIYTPERDLRFENGSRVNDFPGRPLLNDKNITEKTGVILASIDDFKTLMI
ncbi:aminopeptidase P N-terminal domain-containing protein [Maribacter aquivivus]|uniref:aminopeptidase P N-terminal domain-containing protein n=1 Tax=Maribacter aquivivus TaxID=228958 RepID=UPI002490A8A7|nr:aminopeptidase P N-terminal domain-containing protein [Maribacter aquivivus]